MTRPQSGDSSELAPGLPCKGKSLRNRGVSQIMLFLVIPRSLLRGGFIRELRISDLVLNQTRDQRRSSAMSIVSHLHQLFNAEMCHSYIHALRWKGWCPIS